MEIKKLEKIHYVDVARIYQQAIDAGNITLATKTASWEDWDKEHLTYMRFVAISNENVIGWVALSPVLQRTGYQGVTELSIYIDENKQGNGVGKILMHYIIDQAEQAGIWTILSFIFPENKRSIELHKKFGFKLLGTQEKAAKLNGIWMDNCILERRSTII
ncbi:N-acetyltransferase family protein [Sphingobacterium sp. SRCM116780]|uniref:GNAT family N-acetyltransferase n=1 Tax=Sphingobacterium sp. SRCM116780 TaxID=2907623 RepID=UPI001F2484CD|nr:GNAT family N-acetyltransferase [Sphingobacterium sp. SRCM116780]UIR55611.1 N-acetyltransferase family protein [Sphingobacterium sp. SRCM116780]